MADRTTRSTPPPQWAELPTDCLVHVFRRLDLDELASAAPLVCRGWRRAAADPSLWRALDLRRDHLARFMPWGALAGALRASTASTASPSPASSGSASPAPPAPSPTSPSRRYSPRRSSTTSPPSARRCGGSHCPSSPADDCASRHSSAVARLTHLELDSAVLLPGRRRGARAALPRPRRPQGHLRLRQARGRRGHGGASPLRGRLRSLCLDRCYLPRQELLAILAGCGGAAPLREFTARFCVGFDDKDEEVLARGAAIERFDIGGSRLLDEPDGDATNGDDYCDSSYVDVI